MAKRIKKPLMTYAQRGVVRTAENHPSAFVRSFSVLRPVVFEDGEAADIERRLKKQLKAELPHRDLKVFTLVPPEKWCVRFVEQDKLIEELRDRHIKPTQTEILKASASISDPLKRLLEKTPTQLPLPLGAPSQYGTGKLKSDIGFQPYGWNGVRRYSPLRDKAGNVSPMHRSAPPVEILAAESSICNTAVRRMLLEDDGGDAIYRPDSSGTLEHTPYVLVLRNERGMHDDQFRRIAPVLASIMPDIVVGDTSMYVHTDRTNVRPFEPQLRAAA